jgi:hypothetical protein
MSMGIIKDGGETWMRARGLIALCYNQVGEGLCSGGHRGFCLP